MVQSALNELAHLVPLLSITFRDGGALACIHLQALTSFTFPKVIATMCINSWSLLVNDCSTVGERERERWTPSLYILYISFCREPYKLWNSLCCIHIASMLSEGTAACASIVPTCSPRVTWERIRWRTLHEVASFRLACKTTSVECMSCACWWMVNLQRKRQLYEW